MKIIKYNMYQWIKKNIYTFKCMKKPTLIIVILVSYYDTRTKYIFVNVIVK